MSTIGSFNLSTPYQAVTKMNSQLYDAMTTTGDAVTTAIINKFAKTATTQISAKANLAAKAALARIKANTAAKQAAQQALVDKEIASTPLPSKDPQDVTLADGTVIKAPPLSLAGG